MTETNIFGQIKDESGEIRGYFTMRVPQEKKDLNILDGEVQFNGVNHTMEATYVEEYK